MTDKELKILESINKDPETKNLSQDVKEKLAIKFAESNGELVEVIFNHSNSDLLIPFEISLLLLGTNLLGIYVSLILLKQLGVLDYATQENLMKFLNLSENTYYKYRGELEKMKLIKLTSRSRTLKITFNKVSRLPDFKLTNTPKGRIEQLDQLKKLVRAITEEELEQQKEIYINSSIKQDIENKANEKAKEIIKKKEAEKLKEETRFPAEDYNIVLTAYKKYKGVGLLGPEVNRAKHAVKQMFLAQRTPKQIVDCIKFFREHQNLDGYQWLQHWTLETVMKKMPEFVAGTLKVGKIGDDIPDI